jgi:hypothetical protein
MDISARQITLGYGALRVLYAVGLMVAPARVAKPWLGDAAGSAGSVAVRGLGARDLVLSLGAMATARTGQDMRPWLAALAVSDAADLTGTLLAPGSKLPDKAKPGTVAAAGTFGLIGAVLATRKDSAG